MEVTWIAPNDRCYQCQAKRSGTYANDMPGLVYQCKHRACLDVDGKLFCHKHAGVELILAAAGPPPTRLPEVLKTKMLQGEG